MKAKEIRDMGVEELKKKSMELAEELFRLRIRHSSGQLESPSSLGRTRRDIARIKTALREKEAR
jgi:large subunit ribosomal protein L29